jgi:hypothetical protein
MFKIAKPQVISKALGLVTLLAMFSAPFCGSFCAINSCSSTIQHAAAQEDCHHRRLDSSRPGFAMAPDSKNCSAMPLPAAIVVASRPSDSNNVVLRQHIAPRVNAGVAGSFLLLFAIDTSPLNHQSTAERRSPVHPQDTVLRI